MITKNILMRCDLRKTLRITVISRIRIWFRLIISDEWIDRIKAAQPELRTEKLERYKKEFEIPDYDAEILTSSKHMADIFEAATAICKKPKKVSNWLMVETLRLLKENGQDPEDIAVFPGASGSAGGTDRRRYHQQQCSQRGI